ncbi:ATP-binding protein [Moorena sp. SIO3F7]|uniref:sensor histidine kinase n=2 Tax=unclassified Moorena TaxID=2683338 RepID=UPI0025D8682D|nr:ATP-binding protein [Moorena sp. SIO3F7]
MITIAIISPLPTARLLKFVLHFYPMYLNLDAAINRDPLIVSPETLVTEAIAHMIQLDSSYVLVQSQLSLVGIFTERDLLKVIVEGIGLSGLAIANVMTTELITLPATEVENVENIVKLLSRLRQHRIRHLPVVENSGRPTGIITQNSLLQVLEPATMLATNEQLLDGVNQPTAQLEATNHELEAFAYSVSHELSAPLRRIKNFIKVLSKDYHHQLDLKAQHYLQRISANSQHMWKLIDDLLELSRVSGDPMHYQQVDLSKMVAEIRLELTQTQPERSLEWVIAKGIQAYGDSRLLRIVLQNLLHNAWKYTSHHPQARIEFGVCPLSAPQTEGQEQTSDQAIAYFVRDDGAGFDMADADRLFIRFVRLHTEAEFPGNGIGLATVNRIIHRHSGKVWAKSAIEQGATFYFTLPPFTNYSL